MKTDIEYAALVMGWKVSDGYWETRADTWAYDAENDQLEYFDEIGAVTSKRFRPLHNDGDSRRLEIACLNWIGRVIECPKPASLAYAEFAGFLCGIDITPEQYRAAVYALAAAIGKVIDGGGV